MHKLPTVIYIAQARLPALHEEAVTALAARERVDERQDWTNRAQALAAYAKMAKNDTLGDLADRIHARAVRKMGELPKEFDGRGGDRTKTGGTDSSAPTQRERDGRQAGVSPASDGRPRCQCSGGKIRGGR
jgi:hypothetical protein